MAQRNIRISWRQEGLEKTFLEACLHEITLHGREGSSLKALSWTNVAENLKTEHNFIADRKQMKNRYDYLKSKFAAWSKLKNKTGNTYNPVTNTFTMSEEEWQLEIMSNKFVESLRTAPLAYPELCIQLFEGSTASGFESWGPSSTLPRPSEEMSEHNLICIEHIEWTQKETPTQGPSEETPTQGHSEESSLSSKKRRGKRKNNETLKSKLIEVGDQISKMAKIYIEKHTLSNDMGACMEKLRTLGWGEFDANYQTTILLFGESADLRLADFLRQCALAKEEKFNHAHAQLRNVIERAYGVLKARFLILKQMAPFSFTIQRDVVIACFAVHNFIRKCNIHDQLFMDYDENILFSEIQDGEKSGQFDHDIE